MSQKCHCQYSENCNANTKCAGDLPDQPCNGRVLLMGNPNVGKSAFFSRLTGIHALSANYPGTTVGFTEGYLKLPDKRLLLIDAPGAYTLDPTNEAEEVARKFIDEGADLTIIILDATALERNLYLALQVLETGAPCMVALNMADEARHKGVNIDANRLEKELGVPVVPTVAVTGEGIKELLSRIENACKSQLKPSSPEERRKTIEKICSHVLTITPREHSLKDHLEDASVHPLWGPLIGILTLITSFVLIREIGEGTINHILYPGFEMIWLPVLENLSTWLGPETLLHKLVIGSLIDGRIDPEQSFGILSTGIYVPLIMVMPYVLAFYLVLSFLEDFGYLPRLAVLFDALFHKMGLHGYAIVPALLGLGCNVPGIMATRVMESPRERFIAATLISMVVPCAGLQAMILGALGDLNPKYIAIVYGSLLVSWIIIGRILHRFMKGISPELIVEIPPYRIPSLRGLVFKLWMRGKGFITEAIPLVLGGVMIANLLYISGVFSALENIVAPFFNNILGLPATAAGPILLGLLRKDVAVGMLIPLELNPEQMVVAMVMLAMTFPCIATFVVLWKELGYKRMLASSGIMIVTACSAGGILNYLFSLY